MSWLAKYIVMTRHICFIGMFVVLFGACKKDDNGTPGTGTIVYQKLDSVLGYQQHATLKIDDDSIPDILLGSLLVIHNNIQHLYLYAATNSKTVNKILVKQGNIEPINGYFGYPLPAGQAIESSIDDQYLWTRIPHKAVLIDITNPGNTKTVNGLWKGLQKHYLGIQLVINNQKHFGWICISHLPDEDVLTIHDLAYNTTPGQPIKAGQR
jgi:hypothetical protein